ncbi:sugar-binding domain-containing protein [Thermoflavifilum thermophilum]|uniref:Beta-galactosidase n=1 Tax=Thermoflavifilum thermophilum TaxID=1393122 RepID=A0A1I7N3Y3_9BACT|nr:sugar-binding domain-containing protein [Thermoflavifilum thermophilum]SFV29306.1 beta-galactosidase [Thermoflavifilum thermophilum]
MVNPNQARVRLLFDEGWKFHRGGAQGAQEPDFDDHNWRTVDLPHDWSIEDLPGTRSPFDSNANTQASGGFTTGGTGWYRKTFRLPENTKGKQVWILFEGVYMNADVWINGHHLGNHPYGYTSFWYDISPYLQWNQNNVLAVEVKNEGWNSRWYAGSGIYRHVWLMLVDSLHINLWGVHVNTTNVAHHQATISVRTQITNTHSDVANVRLITHILNPLHQEVARIDTLCTLPAHQAAAISQQVSVPDPALWSLDTPQLYKARIEIYQNNQLADEEAVKFGIRTISFDPEHGFQLNGKPLKLHGGCVHHDNGPLGARAYDRAEERRVAILKANGFNAIRCAHNPPSPSFLNACDSLGMLVIDEAFDMWEDPKTPFDYHLYFDRWWKKDLQSTIDRDYNHPSVIIWSIGNEIPNMDSPRVAAMAHRLAAEVHQLDSTRPVTAAVNNVNERKDSFFSALDICGYNYAFDHYDIDHQRHPNRIMMATESFPLMAFDFWNAAVHRPWVIGDFVWTAWDYIGEASIGWLEYPQSQQFYPWTLAYCGDIDICGWKRPQSYYRDVLWKKNQISVFVKPPHSSFPGHPKYQTMSYWGWEDVVADWTWPGEEGRSLEVHVYSSCDSVELLLNGKSLGKKKTDSSNRYIAVWQVPYQAGRLEAVGYTQGQRVHEAVLQTAQAPARIRLIPDRNIIHADGEDLCYVTVEIVDRNGVRNPKATNEVHFQIKGPGEIVGVGNANPMSTESYQQPYRKAWHGRCLVVIRSVRQPGTIVLTATAAGLPTSEVAVRVE